MPCTFAQYRDELQSKLTDLGYDHLRWGVGKNKMECLVINITPGKVSWSDEKDYSAETKGVEVTNLKGFHPDLFMALAAMSAGEKFYAKEWVVYQADNTSHPVQFIDIVDADMDGDERMNVIDNGEIQWQWVHVYRKATEAELIAHFTEITDVVFEDPIIMVESRSFQLPLYGRHLQVWNNGERKRQPGFYIGMTDDNRVIVSSKNPKFESGEDGRILCQKFDNYVDFGTKFKPSKSEIIDILADAYGLHPEQIVLP